MKTAMCACGIPDITATRAETGDSGQESEESEVRRQKARKFRAFFFLAVSASEFQELFPGHAGGEAEFFSGAQADAF